MTPLLKAYYTLRYLGPRFVVQRTALEVRKRLGLTRRRFASRPWASIHLSDILCAGTPTDAQKYASFKHSKPAAFFFLLGRPPAVDVKAMPAEFERRPALAERLDLLAHNRCVYFLHEPSPEAIDWYHNPFDNTRGDSRQVWSDIPDFRADQGDPRVLWEPSRAAWAFDCALARARGLSAPAGELYWRWLDSWMAACPPFQGFQWKCGQESAVRFMALTFGFWALTDDTLPAERWLQFARLAWATGYRIFHHIEYAVSQNNNHALSESCGLLLIAHLFPEFREANAWEKLGREVFESAIRRQVYDDGSYVQHSMNYHRVMLHVSIVAMRIAELAGRPFDRDIYDRIGKATEFLFHLTDPQSGGAPNYGNNDGAYVLPLSECDAADYRPVVQAGHYLVHRTRLLSAGPWDEESLWLFGEEAIHAARCERHHWSSTAFATGGYYKIARRASWAMIRCHTYRDRPGQCDPLHVDLWWKGLNLLRDCGTYRYYLPATPGLERYFPRRAAHNTVEIDDADAVHWVTRFLFCPFPEAHCTRFVPSDDEAAVFEGQELDYQRAPWHVSHRRSVIAAMDDLWIVVDDFAGSGVHAVTARWHMPDVPHELRGGDTVELSTPNGPATIQVCSAAAESPQCTVHRGLVEGSTIAGVAAPYYATLAPIVTLTASQRTNLPARVITFIGLGTAVEASREAAGREGETWKVMSGDSSWRLELCSPGETRGSIFRGMRPAAISEVVV